MPCYYQNCLTTYRCAYESICLSYLNRWIDKYVDNDNRNYKMYHDIIGDNNNDNKNNNNNRKKKTKYDRAENVSMK